MDQKLSSTIKKTAFAGKRFKGQGTWSRKKKKKNMLLQVAPPPLSNQIFCICLVCSLFTLRNCEFDATRSHYHKMDVGVHPVWTILLADRIDQAISLWHDHRNTAILVLLVVLLVARFYLRSGRSKASSYETGPDVSPKDTSALTGTIEIQREASNAGQNTTSQLRPRAIPQRGPKLVTGRRPQRIRSTKSSSKSNEFDIKPLIFFCSLTGTTEKLAHDLLGSFGQFQGEVGSKGRHCILSPDLHDLAYIDFDDFFISGPSSNSKRPIRYIYFLLLPSYDIDSILNTFLSNLEEIHNDFRIDTAPLASLLGYSVFGVGDKDGWPSEAEGYCAQAVQVDKWMAKLTGRKRAYPLGTGNVKGDLRGALEEWTTGVQNALLEISDSGSLGEGVPGSGAAVESEDEDLEEEFPDPKPRKRQKTSKLADLEDVRGPSAASNLPVDFTTYSKKTSEAPKEMVPKTSPTYTALTKQGYTIVGSHSGVKICRWTKSALRGRGSCYKNSFYGIKSHLCMETTPSLSCSNKCVFCWRHGTNPVSTTWRWQVDDPLMIFNGAKEGHYKKIKMMRGVPGVRSDRFEEAMRIRHCALSLVGEPIFYPRINEFVGLLHGERISSFLVCNAQHPDQLQSLNRVTQLYVSIDASNRESLRKIDRPLHRDFWERFQKCLDILREKRFVQRTVFRLTLVKGFNIEEEVEGYADLVAKGLPCFVEIKGVTYCGTSTSAGAGLTMANVPWYEEIVEFVEALNKALMNRGLDYGIAAEHAHSCCVLLASKRFHIEGRWNTLIDYNRFFDLLEGGKEFRPEDYCAPTSEWALWGSGGFDPADERVDRKGRKIENADPRRGVGKVNEIEGDSYVIT